MEILNYLFVAICVLYSVYYYFTRTFKYWSSKGVIGPKPVPFFGNIKDTALRRKTLTAVYRAIYDDYPNEKVVGIYRMMTPAVLIRDLDVIKHVMIKDFDMFVDRGMELSDDGLGANLFFSDGDTWRLLRHQFTPLFTSGKLKNMLYLIIEKGDSFVDNVSEIIEKQQEQEIHSLMQRYTVSTIAACAFGLDLNSNDENIMQSLKRIDNLIFTLNFTLELDIMYPGILKKINSTMFPKFLTKFFNDLVNNVILQRDGKPTCRNDFMDLILELRQKKIIKDTRRDSDVQKCLDLTDDVIAAQAFVFYAAGYETSATMMTFLLYEMAKNPDIQDKLIAHIDEVLHKFDGKFTYESIVELTYLETVMAETLRKYPLGEPLLRKTNADYEFPGIEVTLNKGQTVMISVMGIHHDEKYYTNPEKFDPERFTPENCKDRHPCAYMPFGLGPRQCIGIRFAKLQAQVGIAKFFSKFRVEFSENTKSVVEFDPKRILICPMGGILLNIIKRQRISNRSNS